MAMDKANIILQFRFELEEIKPVVWRRVQVPSKYSFWDLHVAIQDSMGWLDYHLHEFRVRMPGKRKIVEIGIPDDDYSESTLPGWDIPLAEYFTQPGNSAAYSYDFGDAWEHKILLEGILLKEKGLKYPRCIAGERACPPEDCGGAPGYYELIEILKNPKNPEYRDIIGWLKGHAKNYYPYDPDYFNPADIVFWNPMKRWKLTFS